MINFVPYHQRFVSAITYSQFRELSIFCSSSFHALVPPALSGKPGRLWSLAGCKDRSSVQVLSRQWLPHCQESSMPLLQTAWQARKHDYQAAFLTPAMLLLCELQRNFIFLQGYASQSLTRSWQHPAVPWRPKNSRDTSTDTSFVLWRCTWCLIRGQSCCDPQVKPQ